MFEKPRCQRNSRLCKRHIQLNGKRRSKKCHTCNTGRKVVTPRRNNYTCNAVSHHKDVSLNNAILLIEVFYESIQVANIVHKMGRNGLRSMPQSTHIKAKDVEMHKLLVLGKGLQTSRMFVPAMQYHNGFLRRVVIPHPIKNICVVKTLKCSCFHFYLWLNSYLSLTAPFHLFGDSENGPLHNEYIAFEAHLRLSSSLKPYLQYAPHRLWG